METRSLAKPSSGYTPRNAVCGRCGYHISGTRVENRALTCPECGHVNPLVLVPPVSQPRAWIRWGIIAGAFLPVVVFALLAWHEGLQRWILPLGVLLVVGVLVVLAGFSASAAKGR